MSALNTLTRCFPVHDLLAQLAAATGWTELARRIGTRLTLPEEGY